MVKPEAKYLLPITITWSPLFATQANPKMEDALQEAKNNNPKIGEPVKNVAKAATKGKYSGSKPPR